MKLGLAIRGKWTLEHDVSQDVYNYIYTYLQKWSFKNLCHCQYFIHTWILLFLVGYFETEYVKNDLKLYFLEIIYYMIYDLYWQYCNKEITFSNGQLDSLQPLPTQRLSVGLQAKYCYYGVVQCYRLLFGVSVASLRLVLLFPIGITHRVFSNLYLCLANV